MKAFVTGATGMLGNNLIRALAARGWEIKALVRSKEKAARVLAGVNVELVEGDMTAVGEFAPAMEGCDALFHTAAYFREYFQPRDHWQQLQAINIDGTIQLLTQAEWQGVKKAIYVSSSGFIGRMPDGSPGNENAPASRVSESNLYVKSKRLSEEAVQRFLAGHKLPVVLILPGWIYGPWDAAPTSAGQLILDFMKRKLPGVLAGGSAIVDARDVAQAMIAAVEKGRSGERYIVGGKYHSMAEVFGLLENVSGVPAPRLPAPAAMMRMVSFGSELVSRFTGQPPLAPKAGVEIILAKLDLDSRKAIRELGASFRPLSETLRDEIAWFRQMEMLPRAGTGLPAHAERAA